MRIIVLDYPVGEVDVITVDSAYIKDNFDDDIEEYLKSKGYNIKEIEFMTNFSWINIKDNDSYNQIC